MEPLPPEQSEQPEIKIDKARKIILWIFIVGFWLFFYWYKGSAPPEKTDPPKIEQNTPSPGKSESGNQNGK